MRHLEAHLCYNNRSVSAAIGRTSIKQSRLSAARDYIRSELGPGEPSAPTFVKASAGSLSRTDLKAGLPAEARIKSGGRLVELRGIEPLTSAVRLQRSPI